LADRLYSYADLPTEGGFSGCAWDVWGKGDELGTINLLTPEVVSRTAREEIKSGVAISLNWALNMPDVPFFGRACMQHSINAKTSPAYVERRSASIARLNAAGHGVEDRSDPNGACSSA
jgi:hypothetical protein